jgi:Zn-dependent protease
VSAEWLVNGLVQYVVLIFSMIVHEAAHAWTAKHGGDLTAYYGGQISLDPVPHMRREPFGMIVVPIMTYIWSGWMMGWASAPFDPSWAWRHPKKAAWVSLAGPLSNLTIAVVASLILRGGTALGVLEPGATEFAGGVASAAYSVVFWMLFLNCVLFVFNLFPIPPLDGASVLGLFLSEDAARSLQATLRKPVVAMIGMVLIYTVVGRLVRPFVFALVSMLVS